MNSLSFSIIPLSGHTHFSYRKEKKERERYKITWIKSGGGLCAIDLQPFPVSGESIHIVLPGIPYYFKADSEVKGYMLEFTQEFLHLSGTSFTDQFIKLSLPGGYPGNRSGKSEEMMKLGAIMEALFIEYNNSGLKKPRILSGWISILLLYIADLFPDAGNDMGCSKPGQVMTRFFALLEKKFHLKKTVADYADELNIVPDHLTFIIKQASGYPTSHHIKQRILLEAKRLALYSDENMKTIAYRLGFDEPAHFSRFFKINCGKSFRDFKRTHAASVPRTADIQ